MSAAKTLWVKYIIFLVKNEKLQKMLQLQKVELELVRTQSSLTKLIFQAGHVVKRIEELRKRRDDILKSVENLKRELKKYREMIEECKTGAKRAEERLQLVKKAEEYKALLREKARHEDCVIKLTNSLRDLEEKLKKLEEDKEDKKLLKEIQELEEELEDLNYSQSKLLSRVNKLTEELHKLRQGTEREVLDEYEALKRRHGLPVILPADSSGSCTNCGTKLPSALYSRLIKGEVVICPNCGRLVYYEGEA